MDDRHPVNDPVAEAMRMDKAVLEARWAHLQGWINGRFGHQPGIEGILFLIGIQSRGLGYRPKLKKEVKQDLIMEGTYRAFEQLGLYRRTSMDSEGTSGWERTETPLPTMNIEEQEQVLQVAILAYFEPYVHTSTDR